MLLIEAGTHLIVDAIIVSIPHRRASPGEKTATLGCTGDAIDVGQRFTLLYNGTSDASNWM